MKTIKMKENGNSLLMRTAKLFEKSYQVSYDKRGILSYQCL